MQIENLLGYLIPVVSVILSYILGRLESSAKNKCAMDEERYRRFYVPFISELYLLQMWDIPMSCVSEDEHNKVFALVANNFALMDAQTIDAASIFYNAALKLGDVDQVRKGEYDDEGGIYPAPDRKDFMKIWDNYDRAFVALTESVLTESTKLCTKVKLPDIGKSFRKRYQPSLCIRSIAKQEANLQRSRS